MAASVPARRVGRHARRRARAGRGRRCEAMGSELGFTPVPVRPHVAWAGISVFQERCGKRRRRAERRSSEAVVRWCGTICRDLAIRVRFPEAAIDPGRSYSFPGGRVHSLEAVFVPRALRSFPGDRIHPRALRSFPGDRIHPREPRSSARRRTHSRGSGPNTCSPTRRLCRAQSTRRFSASCDPPDAKGRTWSICRSRVAAHRVPSPAT